MGHKLPNAQLLADAFANSHHLVLMPDLFHADAIDLNALLNGYDWQEWLTRHGPETVDPTITTMIAEMKTKYGYEKIGAVGYCFGAKYVIRHLRPDQIDVGYCAHPSFVDVSFIHHNSPLFSFFSLTSNQGLRTSRHQRSPQYQRGRNRLPLPGGETARERKDPGRDKTGVAAECVFGRGAWVRDEGGCE